jgi:MFS family permease
MALSNVALFGGAFLTPVFVGRITYSIGWQWTFYFVAIFMAAALPFLIFFVPETAFRRPDYLNIDYNTDLDQPDDRPEHDDNSDVPSSTPVVHKELESSALHHRPFPQAEHEGISGQTEPRKKPFREQIRLFSGRKTDEQFFKLLLRPFPLFFHPGIFWVRFLLPRRKEIEGEGLPFRSID